MKKKIIFIIVLILTVTTLTGCSNKEGDKMKEDLLGIDYIAEGNVSSIKL